MSGYGAWRWYRLAKGPYEQVAPKIYFKLTRSWGDCWSPCPILLLINKIKIVSDIGLELSSHPRQWHWLTIDSGYETSALIIALPVFFRTSFHRTLTCKTLAVWTYTYYRLEEFVTPARGVTSIKVTNYKLQVFAILARGISSINFSARLVKQRWSRDGNCTVLRVLIKGYYYVLAPLGGNRVRRCFRNGDLFLSQKRPFKLLINHVIWDTCACAREPTLKENNLYGKL